MKQEVNDFSVINELYANFTEENKESIYKTAKTLLKVQKQDTEILASAPLPKNQNEKEGLA